MAERARRLERNYKNVHTDVAQLIEWMAVERGEGEDGLVNVPWSEIVVDMKEGRSNPEQAKFCSRERAV